MTSLTHPGNVDRPGYSPLESLLLLPPIATCVFSFLNTPDYLCVRNASRTMRCFVDNNRRFFKNMVFLKRGAERWLDILESDVDNIISEEHYNLTISETVLEISETHRLRELKEAQGKKRALERLVAVLSAQDDAWAEPAMEFWRSKHDEIQIEVKEIQELLGKHTPFRITDFYYPRLMGRHLSQIMRNLPVGRNLTSMILDGTGVDTEWIQYIMCRYASTLRGLSVRECPNIDVYVFADWILDSLYRHKPFSLKWLRVGHHQASKPKRANGV